MSGIGRRVAHRLAGGSPLRLADAAEPSPGASPARAEPSPLGAGPLGAGAPAAQSRAARQKGQCGEKPCARGGDRRRGRRLLGALPPDPGRLDGRDAARAA